MMDKKKHVDESWKEQALGEQSQNEDPASAESAAPEPEAGNDMDVNFLNYITSLGFQAMIFMGVIPHPMTDKIEKSLPQARFLIDTLIMLKEKTAGNLNDQESNLLESSIYELQMKYVELIQAETSSEKEKTQ